MTDSNEARRGIILSEEQEKYLAEKIKALREEFDKLIENGRIEYRAMNTRIAKIENEQAETRVYVKQIRETLDDIKLGIQNGITKEDLFRIIGELNNTRKQANTDSSDTLRTVLDYIKWVLGATILLALGWVFGHTK